MRVRIPLAKKPLPNIFAISLPNTFAIHLQNKYINEIFLYTYINNEQLYYYRCSIDSLIFLI